MAPGTRYRFADFEVSRRERQVRRQGEVLPLIPRYFDLLVLLIERRPAVVTRREIFDVVWGDVIVSDGALSQAVRTLRRALGDQSREPMFIRTVSRHGYSFVFAEVVEDVDPPVSAGAPAGRAGAADRATSAQAVALAAGSSVADRAERLALALASSRDRPLEERRDLAQQLHGLGTRVALDAIARHPRPAESLALLRDTRWDVPQSAAVPLLGSPGGLAAAWMLIRLRAADALAVVRRRWAAGALGGSAAGALAGAAGGSLLWLAPASAAPASAIVVLAMLGATAGLIAAGGVAAGVSAAEALARSRRGLAIVIGSALGGFGIGLLVSLLGGWTMQALFGLGVSIGGPLEGLVLGAAVGLAYAVSTPRPQGGIAAVSGGARVRAALACAACGAIAAACLAFTGHALVGGTIHMVALASQGSQIALTPLGLVLGEPEFGPLSRGLVAAFEGGMFGLGLSLGLTGPVQR